MGPSFLRGPHCGEPPTGTEEHEGSPCRDSPSSGLRCCDGTCPEPQYLVLEALSILAEQDGRQSKRLAGARPFRDSPERGDVRRQKMRQGQMRQGHVRQGQVRQGYNSMKQPSQRCLSEPLLSMLLSSPKSFIPSEQRSRNRPQPAASAKQQSFWKTMEKARPANENFT